VGVAERAKKIAQPGDFSQTLVGRPAGSPQPQEKGDLEEQPDRAPEGIDDEPELIRKLEAEMVFRTLPLPHLAHLTSWQSLPEVEITSKTF
jgi:hypothetical protein